MGYRSPFLSLIQSGLSFIIVSAANVRGMSEHNQRFAPIIASTPLHAGETKERKSSQHEMSIYSIVRCTA